MIQCYGCDGYDIREIRITTTDGEEDVFECADCGYVLTAELQIARCPFTSATVSGCTRTESSDDCYAAECLSLYTTSASDNADRGPMISLKTDMGSTPMHVIITDYADSMRWWL